MASTLQSWYVANIPNLVLFTTPIVAIVCFADGALDSLYDTICLVIAIILVLTGVFVSVLAARYAFINFDDVVSRRMRYRNSKVDMGEHRFVYTTLCFIKWLIAWCTLETILIVVLSYVN